MYKAILSLKTVDECMRFFDDLCTVTELMAMEQRFQVAVCLNQGMIYNDILAETGASSATISRVNRSLQYGSDGYALVFERMKESADCAATGLSPAGTTGLQAIYPTISFRIFTRRSFPAQAGNSAVCLTCAAAPAR